MKLKIAFLFLLITVAFAAIADPPTEVGKTIFSTRCASCHNVNKIVVGPALAGVDGRHSIDWIINFVHSSQTVIKGGDKEAVALFDKFNHIPMPDHPDLKAEDIKSVVEYIKLESSSSATADKAPFSKPTRLHPAYTPLSFYNYGFFLGLFSAIVIMILSLVAFVRVKEYERNKMSNRSY